MAFAPSASTALRPALAAVDLAFSDPGKARRLAAAALQAAAGDPEPIAVAQRATGMALTSLGRLTEAETHLRMAVDVAERGRLPVRAAEARGSMAYLLVLTGRSSEALDAVDTAAPELDGVSAARVQMLRGLVLYELGRFREATAGYGEALRMLRETGGNDLLEADIRNNRSFAATRHRDWATAEADLDRAEVLYVAAGHPGRTALVYHNRGVTAAARGDVPAALAAYDEAAERYRASGREDGLLPIERAEALLSVLLVAEARSAAEQGVLQLARKRNAVDLVQARIVLARAALLAGDYVVAGDQAERARRAAIRQQRSTWAALAGYLALRARWEGGERGTAIMRSGRRSANALDAAGWVVEAVDSRLIVARTALELGRSDVARRELARRELAGAAHDDGPAQLRARTWHAQALLRLAEGDPAGADAALLAGVRVLDQFRASLGATELRVHAAGHAGEIARTGLQLALTAGDAGRVLGWAERWRAGALMLRPVRPADDADLALDLAELRQVAAELAGSSVGTVGTVGATRAELEALRQRQTALEEQVRQRSRRTRTERTVEAGRLPSLAALHAALGPATLVEYVAVDEELHAVVLQQGSMALRQVGELAAVEDDVAALRYGMRRLAHPSGSVALKAAAAVLVEGKAERLDAVLLEPLLAEHGGPLIIVPTGGLHALPWAALPSCAGRAVSIAPSAALWHRAAALPDAGGRRVFVAGPGLSHAAGEVVAAARRYPGAARFTGRRSSAGAVTAALDGAELAHIAAHGAFRADNPLFSSLRLADGPLTVYDLEQLGRPPRHVILSACESGLSSVHPGDELLGLTAALLAMGSRSLIASVIPVPDAAVRTLMLTLHRHLRTGHSPAAALALAQRALSGAGEAERMAATGFLCFGAG